MAISSSYCIAMRTIIYDTGGVIETLLASPDADALLYFERYIEEPQTTREVTC